MSAPLYLTPSWPAPLAVRAAVTTRVGGVSIGPYASLNLGDHVGDDPVAVAANRGRIATALGLPQAPQWLSQVHGRQVVPAHQGGAADGVYSHAPGEVCAVLTADCLPVLLCSRQGSAVAAAHAGWRGLLGGVLETAVAALAAPPGEVLAWLGPAIGAGAFEVGPEVREAFCQQAPGAAVAFAPGRGGRWHADLFHLARRRLLAAGVAGVYGGGRCTYNESAHFFSFRRDGTTGRMASLIWLAGRPSPPQEESR